MKSNDLRPGMAIRDNGLLFVVTQFTHVTPGNLRAFCQVKLRNVATGQLIDKRLRSGEEVEGISLDKRPMEYLYPEADGYVFMDTENFEQFSVPKSFLEDSIGYIKANTVVVMLLCEEKVVSVELPKTVELVVADTTPSIKSATVTNVGKDATMETGLKTKVPDFIKIGECVRLSTEDGSYLSRV